MLFSNGLVIVSCTQRRKRAYCFVTSPMGWF